MTTSTLQLIAKIIVSGVFVGLVSEAGKRLPTLGGLLAALPIISLLTIFWLLVDGKTTSDVVHTIRGILIGLVPTTIFLILFGVLLSRDVKFGVALGISLGVLAALWLFISQLVL